MVLLSIRLLGDLSAVDYRGNALSIGNRRTQALVVYLGLKIGNSPSIREIGELLFGDATAAVQVHFPEAILKASRTPAIMADAAHAILTSDPRANTGNFYIDEQVLAQAGERDFSRYSVTPGARLFTDLFVEG